jgi:5-methylcytosine-specific restriction endonuclease McrA
MPRSIVRSRAAAFIRQRGRCFYCGYPMWWSDKERYSSLYQISLAQARQFQCTAEHLRPRRDGGNCSRSNIVAACRTCNLRRHVRKKSLTPEKFKRLVHGRLVQGRWHVYPMPPNSRLLSDANLSPIRER